MRKTIVALVAAFALMFGMSACGVNVEAGTVAEKRLVEAYTEQVEVMDEQCETETETKYKTVNGKRTSYQDVDTECEDVPTGEFEDVDHPAEYYLTLEDKDGNSEEISVDADEFESVSEGEFFDSNA